MESLDNQRKEYSETDKAQLKLIGKFFEQRRERFESADTHLWMSQNQNSNDLLFITNSFFEWQKGLEPTSKKSKVLENMIQTMFRIESYCRQAETVSKASVSEYIEERKVNTRLESDIKTLKLKLIKMEAEFKTKLEAKNKEIDVKNKEIEFIQNSGISR